MKMINSLLLMPTIKYITFKAHSDIREQTEAAAFNKNDLIENYLIAKATLNMTAIRPLTLPSQKAFTYKNNLRTMIQNNESVMLAIAPRTFTAVDLNGDEKITLSLGEKPGTFLSAIDRLDELKEDGFNTIHVLPIHPPGKKKAMGTAGSLYAPAKLVTDDGHLAIDPILIDRNDPRRLLCA